MMTYEQQHTVYLERCNAALDDVAENLFQANSEVSKSALYTLMNGGKRVRGVLTLAVCDMLGGNLAAGAVFAAALEMIHCFSLIHDDLPCIDDDNMRRGKPANHIVHGEAIALLAGDLLALEAFEAVAKAPIDAEQQMKAITALAGAAGARGMIYGQELDLKYETAPADEAVLHQIHQNKTGALLKAAAQLGVFAASKPMTEHEIIISYAENIGLVFQIVDDILDVTADEAQLGKPIGSDAQQGKVTFVTLFGLPKAHEKAEQLSSEAIQKLQQKYGENSWFLCEFAKKLARRVY